MDEIAEKGYAAHYKYKNGANEEWLRWLNLLKEALENSGTCSRFCRRFQNEFVKRSIYLLQRRY
jgi:GTP pyrophosphokinase